MLTARLFSADPTQRAICCRIFHPAVLPEYPAASVRDYCSGAFIEREHVGESRFNAPETSRVHSRAGRSESGAGPQLGKKPMCLIGRPGVNLLTMSKNVTPQ